MLITYGNVEYGASPGNVQPFVAVAHEEVGIQGSEVQWDVSCAVCAVDAREDRMGLADLRETFEGHAYAGKRDDGVEDGEFGGLALRLNGCDGVFETCDEGGVRDGVGIGHFPRCDGRGLGQVGDSLAAGAIDGVEVDDDVSGSVLEVAQDRVDPRGGVGQKDATVGRSIEILRDGLAGLVQLLWVFIADEGVWPPFRLYLEVLKERSDEMRKGAKRACALSARLLDVSSSRPWRMLKDINGIC